MTKRALIYYTVTDILCRNFKVNKITLEEEAALTTSVGRQASTAWKNKYGHEPSLVNAQKSSIRRSGTTKGANLAGAHRKTAYPLESEPVIVRALIETAKAKGIMLKPRKKIDASVPGYEMEERLCVVEKGT